MANLLKKLLKGNSGCCNIKVEEVRTEVQGKDLPNVKKAQKGNCCSKN